MQGIGVAARAAARVLAFAPEQQKNRALLEGAAALRGSRAAILAANSEDLREAGEGLSAALLDRLRLDEVRVESMAQGLSDIAGLADPIGVRLAHWSRPNGMRIERVRVPLGVIGIIYESRPNVTADAGALCLKSGNAVILRGGSESAKSSAAIHACLQQGLKVAGLPDASIQGVPTTDRAAVGHMLAEMTDSIDVIVPRGGKSLIARVQKEARVPVIGHLEGVCHVFIDRGANLDMARRIVVNAKMRRTGVCGSAETLLVDRACAPTHLAPLIKALLDAGCEVRGDELAAKSDARVKTGRRARLVCRISRRHYRGACRRRRGRGHCAHRPIRFAAHRLHRYGRSGGGRTVSYARSTAPSCFTMPRRSLPMAANSAWVPKSALAPTSSMRAARSALNN